MKKVISRLLIAVLLLSVPFVGSAKTEPSLFSDVKKGSWYYDSVRYVAENGLMVGIDESHFSPDATFSRAMLVTVLWRIDGEPSGKTNAFTDVKSNSWYGKAVAWGYNNGIVGGYGNGLFGPNDPITREQLVTMFARYAEYCDIDTDYTADLGGFTDTKSIGSWAKKAVHWAVAEELINGVSSTLLSPTTGATRAQAATILQRFCNTILSQSEASFYTLQEGAGSTFETYSRYDSDIDMVNVAQTYEAWIRLPADLSEGAGAILGDYQGKKAPSFHLEILKNGVPRFYYQISYKKYMNIDFTKVNLPADTWVHLTVMDDIANNELRCYVNGTLAQRVALTKKQKTYTRTASEAELTLGCAGHDGNVYTFKGAIRSLVLYQDIRTQAELQRDITRVDLSNADLLFCQDLSDSDCAPVFVDLAGKMNFINSHMTDAWLEEVAAPTDFDYSIALLGDTQMLTAYYPETMHTIFDWLLENKEAHKIEHVLNLGDFTNFNLDEEWELCVEQYFRLNGQIDYTLVRGDHDILNDKIDGNGDDKAKYDRFFGVPAYLSRFDAEGAGYYQGTMGSITNSYREITLGNTDYLILTLDKDPSDDVVAWAKNVLETHTESQVIMTMHCYLSVDGDRLVKNVDAYAPTGFDGEDVWQELASQYANVKFVISGHTITDKVVWTKDVGKHGNIVNQILVDPQAAGLDSSGPTGMICMLYFKEGSDEVQVRYYSAFLDRYYHPDNQYTINIADMSTPSVIK